MSDKERDELATIISDSAVPRDGKYMIVDRIAADDILAAGYRKPRTITTVTELLALHMVVVRTAGGSVANIVNERAFFFGYEASCSARTLALPATVLHEPTP